MDGNDELPKRLSPDDLLEAYYKLSIESRRSKSSDEGHKTTPVPHFFSQASTAESRLHHNLTSHMDTLSQLICIAAKSHQSSQMKSLTGNGGSAGVSFSQTAELDAPAQAPPPEAAVHIKKKRKMESGEKKKEKENVEQKKQTKRNKSKRERELAHKT